MALFTHNSVVTYILINALRIRMDHIAIGMSPFKEQLRNLFTILLPRTETPTQRRSVFYSYPKTNNGAVNQEAVFAEALHV